MQGPVPHPAERLAAAQQPPGPAPIQTLSQQPPLSALALANPARVTRSLSRSSSPIAAEVTLAGLGTLRGDVWGSVVRFLEVPFAAPPIGNLRWRPPQPPIPWKGVRCNPGRLTQCPQAEVGLLQGTFQGRRIEDNEDCLVLNVFAPRARSIEESSVGRC